jgi:prefoldin subunit 5
MTFRPPRVKPLCATAEPSSRFKAEIDILKRELRDQMQHLQVLKSKVDQLDQTMSDANALIGDLSRAIEKPILTPEQQSKFSQLLPAEISAAIRSGVHELIDIHSGLAGRFEHDFSVKATAITSEISALESRLESLRRSQAETENNNRKLDRLVHINEIEKQSLIGLARKLQIQVVDADSESQAQLTSVSEEIARLKHDTAGVRAQSALTSRRNADLVAKIGAPLPRKLKENLREDVALEAELTRLRALFERVKSDQLLAKEELAHMRSEIDRANEDIRKFRKTHRPEVKANAEQVNEDLRKAIADQRHNFQSAIRNQKKKNKEYERQKADMIEEQEMLSQYLGIVEKDLAAQMLKLPALAHIQPKSEAEQPPKRVRKKKPKQPDDPEMRSIKRSVSQFQSRQKRAQGNLT